MPPSEVPAAMPCPCRMPARRPDSWPGHEPKPLETRPRRWETSTGQPGGFLGAPSGRLGCSCQLSQPETVRSFGGRSSPRLTSALPPAWGPHLATPPRSRHPATHSGWTPVPRPGGLGGRTCSCGVICSVSPPSPPRRLSPHSRLLLPRP